MKRGLKARLNCTYESDDIVATIAPMKRGLKGRGKNVRRFIMASSNHCPDEKGTESNVYLV